MAGRPPVPASTFVNWETPQVHPLDLTPNGQHLLAVNTAANRLELFDVRSGDPVWLDSIPVGLDPVSVRAQSDGRAWVVNQVSDTISIVDLTTRTVVATLTTQNEPADVVFSSGRAFVTCAQANSVMVFDAARPTSLTPQVLPLSGASPRALAVSPDGQRVYAAFFESGNGSTILAGGRASDDPGNVVDDLRGPYGGVNPPPNAGSSFVPPINPANPRAPRVGMIVQKNAAGQWLDDNQRNWTPFVSGSLSTRSERVAGWDLPDRDVAVIDVNTLAVTYQSRVMSTLSAVAVNPSSGEVTVVGLDATNQIRYVPNLQGRFIRVNFAGFLPGGTNRIVDLNPHLTYTVPTLPANQRTPSLGDPRGIAWNRTGDRAYVTGMGSNNLVVIDRQGNRTGIASAIPVGQGPTGVVVHDGLQRAFVLNRFEGTISTVSLSNEVEVSRQNFYDPTPSIIKNGRPFLYDTHLSSGLGHIACASCHIDGRHDLLGWDLGNPAGTFDGTFHPMKGPMRTQTLIDVVGSPLMHFRGDRNNLREFNEAFADLQGLEQPMSLDNMILLESFLGTTRTPPNPYRNLDNSLPSSVIIPGPGNRVGNPQGVRPICAECHTGSHFRGATRSITDNAAGNQMAAAPPLRSMYRLMGLHYNNATASTAGFGFIADGSFSPTTQATLRNNNFLAFMMAADGDLPGDTHAAVGKQATIGGETVGDSFLIDQLAAIADTGRIGLTAHGCVNRETRGFSYSGGGRFQSDRSSQQISLADLRATAALGNAITFTAVPAGTQVRIGIDRDANGILDGDESGATTSSVACGAQASVAPITNAGFEDLTLAPGGSTQAPPSGWTTTATVSGVWYPTGGFTASEGHNVLYINSVGTMTRTLADRFALNTGYRLRVFVGDELGGAEALGWQIRLMAGTTVLGTLSAAHVRPPDGGWVEVILNLSPAQLSGFGAAVGQPLRIELSNTNATGHAYFDNIRLEVFPAGSVPPVTPILAPIANAGFEAQVFAPGGYTRTAPSGWTTTATTSGPWYPAGAFTAPEGRNILYIDTTGTVSQTLTTRFVTGTAYRLRALVGDELGGTVALGWQMRLVAGTTVLGTVSAAQVRPPDGGWVEAILDLQPAQLAGFSAAIGQPLRIELANTSTSGHAYFDNIRLEIYPDGTVTPPPPPPTTTLAPITNAGFEAQVFAPGGYTRTAPSGWTTTATTSGPWYPAGAFTAPEGRNILYIDTTGTVSQTLTTRFVTGTAYRLRALVGDELGGTVALGWQMRLVAGTTVLGTMSAAQLRPPDGRWVEAILDLQPAQLAGFSAAVGQPLRIELSNTNATGHAYFDNIRLEITTP